MLKWLFALCVFCVCQVRAEEVDLLAPEPVVEEITETAEQVVTAKDLLPACDNQELHEQVKSVIKEYNETNSEKSLIARRRQALQLRFLSEYTEEKVTGFTSKQNREVADKLIITKINKGLVDSQVRICKSVTDGTTFEPVYLLMYVDDNKQVEVFVLNYSEKPNQELKFWF